jgi:hypothetical protein
MPMTGRVSSESNHVDMRRDWVVEVSQSLADSNSFVNNGPNAAIDSRANLHFTQCSAV